MASNREAQKMRESSLRKLEEDLKKLREVNTLGKLKEVSDELYEHSKLNPRVYKDSWEADAYASFVREQMSEIDSIPESATPDVVEREKNTLIFALTGLIKELKDLQIASDIGSVMATEKEFLSEKVPKEVAEKIASYVTGKRGSIGAQASQVKYHIQREPDLEEGGRRKKTKKNRSRRKKTRSKK